MCETSYKALLKLELFNSSILQAILTLGLDFQSQEGLTFHAKQLMCFIILGYTGENWIPLLVLADDFLRLPMAFTFHRCVSILWKKTDERSLPYSLDRYRLGVFWAEANMWEVHYSHKLCQGLLAGRCAQKHRQELTRLGSHKGCGKRWMGECFGLQSCLALVKLAPGMFTTSSRKVSGNWRCWFSRENKKASGNWRCWFSREGKNKACCLSTELRREPERDN